MWSRLLVRGRNRGDFNRELRDEYSRTWRQRIYGFNSYLVGGYIFYIYLDVFIICIKGGFVTLMDVIEVLFDYNRYIEICL
jgi:hypothetical protein